MRPRYLAALSLALLACTPAPRSRGLADVTTGTAGEVSVQGEVTDLAWGDVDGDGDLDLALSRGDGQPQSNLLLLNTEGSFEEVELPGGAARSRTLAWGDCDGDGDLDLAIGNDLDEANHLLINDGGTLSPAEDGGDFTSGADVDDHAVNALAWGDFDADGDLDLAAGTDSYEPELIYENAGCRLTEVEIWNEPPDDRQTRALAWADFDGDDALDLWLASGDSTELTESELYWGDGAGGLVRGTTQGPAGEAFDLAVADFDADGDLDVAAAMFTDGVRLYSSRGPEYGFDLSQVPGTQGDGVGAAAAADQDGDGYPDLAVVYHSWGGHMLHPGGEDGPGAADALPGGHQVGVAAAWADVHGDGSPELAVAASRQDDEFEPVLLLIDNPGLALAPVEALELSLPDDARTAWADVDGDGDLDLSTVGSGQQLHLYLWDGGLHPDPSHEVGAGGSAMDMAWADYDADGDLDLALALPGQDVVLTGDAGDLSVAWEAAEQTPTAAVAWADVDGDGDLDLAAAGDGAEGPTVRLYLNSLAGGQAGLVAGASYPAPGAPRRLAWGDPDGDRDPDLFVACAGPDLLLRNEGPLTGFVPVEVDSAGESRDVAWGDLDGDGRLEAAVAGDGPLRVLTGDGSGGLALAWAAGAAEATDAVALGDADGDGDLDLAAGGAATGDPVRIYRGDGAGGLEPAATRMAGARTRDLAWLDVDGDSDLDLWIANPGDAASGLARGSRVGRPILQDTPTRAVLGAIGPAPAALTSFHQGGLRTWPQVVVPFTVVDPEGDSAPQVRLEYSLSGPGAWQPATLAFGATSLLEGSPSGTPHSITWDAEADGAAGDRVVLRLSVPWQAPRAGTGPIRSASIASISAPFRLHASAPVDADGDGAWSTFDCDDSEPDVHPGAPELCNGRDDDCDGLTAEDDADGDGLLACEDCDDADPERPADSESCHDGVDDDCDGLVDGDDPACWWGCALGGGRGESGLVALLVLVLTLVLPARRLSGRIPAGTRDHSH